MVFPIDLFKLIYFDIQQGHDVGASNKFLKKQVFYELCVSGRIIFALLVFCSYFLNLQCLNLKTAGRELIITDSFF